MYLVINKKRSLLICGLILSAGIVTGSVLGMMPERKASGVGRGENIKIIIDAGHGLPDGGAVGVNGAVESELNLDISEKLSEILENMGFTTKMTRSDKNGIKAENTDGWSKVSDMRIRRQIMKDENAGLFVSIHMNHFTSQNVSGLRLFYSENHKKIKDLAENIQLKIAEVTGAKVTAVRAADRNLFLMKSPPVPAVLVECGFLSNAEEEKKLSNEEYRSKIAWAIAKEIENYYFLDGNKVNQPTVDSVSKNRIKNVN